MAKVKFNNKLKAVKAPQSLREQLLETIKRIKETGDMANSSPEYNEFRDYLNSFYAKAGDGREAGLFSEDWDGGFEDFEMEQGIEDYLMNLDEAKQGQFIGDSLDRERVRDIIAANREKMKKESEAQLAAAPQKQPVAPAYKGLMGDQALKAAMKDFMGYGEELDLKKFQEGSEGHNKAIKGYQAAADFLYSNHPLLKKGGK